MSEGKNKSEQRRGAATWKNGGEKLFNFKDYKGSKKALTEIVDKKEEKAREEIKEVVQKKSTKKEKEEEKVDEKKEENKKLENNENKEKDGKKEEERKKYDEWFQRHSKSEQIQQSKNLKQEYQEKEKYTYERNDMEYYKQWFYKHSEKNPDIEPYKSNDFIEKALDDMREDKEEFDNFDELEQQLQKIEEKKVDLSDINTNISYVTEKLKAIIDYFKSIKHKEQEKLNKIKSAIKRNNNGIKKLNKDLEYYNDNSYKLKDRKLAKYLKQQKQENNEKIKRLEEQNNQKEICKKDLKKIINKYDKKIVQFEKKIKELKHYSQQQKLKTSIKVERQVPRKLFENRWAPQFVLYQNFLYLPYEKLHYTRKYIRIPIDENNKCMLDKMEIEIVKDRCISTISKEKSDEIRNILKNGKVPLYNKKIFNLSSLKDREILIDK